MTSSVARVFRTIQHLSPAEQLELIQAISQSLQRQYQPIDVDAIPPSVKRTPPITDLTDLAADFWPEDESADDINAYVAQQRREDRMRER